jgi:cytochrome c5
MKRLTTTLCAAAVVVLFFTGAPAQEKGDRLSVLEAGKSDFQKACKFCHSLARALSKNYERDAWMETVKRMVSYGAPLDKKQREGVTSYLTAKSLFETNCNACHSNLRVFSDSALGTDWTATVERMSSHMEELAKKDEQSRRLAAEEVEDIAAYLTLNIPKD